MRRGLTLLFLTGLMLSCAQTYNSSYSDAENYGSPVKLVFAQHCTPCHQFQQMTNDQLVAQGEMIKGDALNSKIYYRVVGSNGTNGPKNMPMGGSLSPADVAIIEQFVQTAQ
jgi:mono/diheme cytochrome c family protein